MSRITFSIFFILFSFYDFSVAEQKVELRTPMNQLFNHKNHRTVFSKNGVACTDCHTFSIKSQSFDPLSPNVGGGNLKPNRKTCHECHLDKVDMPRPNQCTLCHLNVQKLAPENHKLSWKQRHGRFAQIDSDSCKQCHTDTQTCTQCHTQRNTLKPSVHRPNFRMMHSIEARSNPASCVTCHSTTSTCLQCHKGGL